MGPCLSEPLAASTEPPSPESQSISQEPAGQGSPWAGAGALEQTKPKGALSTREAIPEPPIQVRMGGEVGVGGQEVGPFAASQRRQQGERGPCRLARGGCSPAGNKYRLAWEASFRAGISDLPQHLPSQGRRPRRLCVAPQPGWWAPAP